MSTPTRIRRTIARVAASAALVTLATVAIDQPVTAHATGADPAGEPAPVAHSSSAAEMSAAANVDVAAVRRTARPMHAPAESTVRVAKPAQGADGPAVTIAGSAPATEGRSTSRVLARASTSDGALWPGLNTDNPNRQVGRLYFDVKPGSEQRWSHCTATVVNSANKSTLITAGHCVVNWQTGFWYQNAYFIPGLENTKKPFGKWIVTKAMTTGNYFYYGKYADDMAMVTVQRDSQGRSIVDRVGGHGLAFNQPVNQWRTSLGYPVTDPRFPGWTSSGLDLYYCQNVDTYYSSGTSAGQLSIPCRMTGGSSGGPWLTNVASSWMGTVGSVNSNGPADTMFAPYFDNAEYNVYTGIALR